MTRFGRYRKWHQNTLNPQEEDLAWLESSSCSCKYFRDSYPILHCVVQDVDSVIDDLNTDIQLKLETVVKGVEGYF